MLKMKLHFFGHLMQRANSLDMAPEILAGLPRHKFRYERDRHKGLR